MAIGTGQVVPQTIPLTATWGQQAGNCEDMYGTAVPRNPDQTVYDCTDLTSLSMVISNGQTATCLLVEATPTPTMITHDATGVYFKVGATLLSSSFASLGVTNAPFNLYGTDGTTIKLLATGTIAFNFRP